MLRTIILFCFSVISYFPVQASISLEDREEYTTALASLAYKYRQEMDDFEGSEDTIQFSTEEINLLWERAAHYLYQQPFSQQRTDHELTFEKAHENSLSGLNSAKETFSLLDELLMDAIREEETYHHLYEINTPLRSKSHGNRDFEDNRLISEKIKKYMRPYVIPDTHPMKKVLDSLFDERVTYNEKEFVSAGFKIISKRPRSYVYVAKHPKLKGYVLKAYMDTEKRLKMYTDSWNWLVKRCIGAYKIRTIINHSKMKYFRVADKWIYPLPDHNLPPKDKKHKFHLAALLAQDMELIPYEENVKKWKTEVTKEMLKELHFIITRARGSSYRADNICFTKKGDLAFIDTEYPSNGPDYYSIRRYLSTPLKDYWDGLVKKGRKAKG